MKTNKIKPWIIEAAQQDIDAGRTTLEKIAVANPSLAAKLRKARSEAKQPVTTLSRWQHPATGEVRIYVNDPSLWRGTKVYFFARENDFSDYRVIAEGPQAHDAARQVAEEIGQKFNGSFAAMLEAAK